MSKNTRTRILLTAVAALLLVTMAVGGTLAWLTAESDKVENTFTTTSIEVELKEHDLVKDATTGELTFDDKTEVTSNDEYLLQPGLTMKKDPFARMTKGNGYVFIEIVPNDIENGVQTSDYISWNVDATKWAEVAGVTGPNDGKVYGYVGTDGNMVAVNEGVTTSSIISEITVSSLLKNSDLTEEKIAQVKLTFYAYAIQSDNLDADVPAEIWTLYGRDAEPTT